MQNELQISHKQYPLFNFYIYYKQGSSNNHYNHNSIRCILNLIKNLFFVKLNLFPNIFRSNLISQLKCLIIINALKILIRDIKVNNKLILYGKW